MNFQNAAKAIHDDLVAWRRAIHPIAETIFGTVETAKLIVRELTAIGIPEADIKLFCNASGVAATIYGGKPGKCLGIRVDIDALPMPEELDLPFKATNGNMHSCGHDAHAAIGLGTAKLIFENRAELVGSVKMIFQPAEEIAAGAAAMIAEGVMEDPKVEGAISLHGTSADTRLPVFPCGSFASTTGFPSTACSSTFRVTMFGKGAHGSAPHLSVDPVFMAVMAISQMQGIISR